MQNYFANMIALIFVRREKLPLIFYCDNLSFFPQSLTSSKSDEFAFLISFQSIWFFENQQKGKNDAIHRRMNISC